jgi:hypothetical protein
VAAPESFLVGRQGPEPWDTWQHRSPPEQGGGVQYHGTRGSVRALSSREAGSRAMRHVVAPEPSRAGRWDLELQGMWSYVLLLVLNLSLYAGYPVCRVQTDSLTGSQKGQLSGWGIPCCANRSAVQHHLLATIHMKKRISGEPMSSRFFPMG